MYVYLYQFNLLLIWRFLLGFSWSFVLHVNKTEVICCTCIYFTPVSAKPIWCYSNLKIIPSASKLSWIWYEFCQNLIIEKIKENHVDISLILVLLEKFSIFLMMKMIEKIVRLWKFFRSSQGKVFIATSSIFIKIRQVLLWL